MIELAMFVAFVAGFIMALSIMARGDQNHMDAWFLGGALVLIGLAVMLRIYAR